MSLLNSINEFTLKMKLINGFYENEKVINGFISGLILYPNIIPKESVIKILITRDDKTFFSFQTKELYMNFTMLLNNYYTMVEDQFYIDNFKYSIKENDFSDKPDRFWFKGFCKALSFWRSSDIKHFEKDEINSLLKILLILPDEYISQIRLKEDSFFKSLEQLKEKISTQLRNNLYTDYKNCLNSIYKAATRVKMRHINKMNEIRSKSLKEAESQNQKKQNRNDKCRCGSGLKFKNCCGKN